MSLNFLPMPRQIEYMTGSLILPADRLIVISDPALLFEAQFAQKALAEFAGVHWQIVAGGSYAHTGLRLAIDPTLKSAQSYLFKVTETHIQIHGADAAGVFYGLCTLRQLLQQSRGNLPLISISDAPDFPVRGVMLDISRDKVPTLQTTLDLIDRLAMWKINEVQLYMEHTFAYQNHPVVWEQASPFTGEEILQLDVFCRQRHVALVPNQNSLGHMERWLKHELYRPLAECPDGFIFLDGEKRAATTLNPVDPASIELIKTLYDELLPHFTSPLFNVGGDEPWEFGQGQSKPAVEQKGMGPVYLEYLLKLYEEVKKRGRQMQFWGDIIIHYPELVGQLPKDTIAMEWGYEADHPFEEHGALFAQSGVPFYVCAGTSSWNSLAGRTANTVNNLQNAVRSGLKNGAIGFLNTDWGDRGHWQPLPVSYLGFAYGAALSWAYAANEGLDLPRVLDLFVFQDSAGVMGQLVYDLGNIYLAPGLARHNGHILFDVLQSSFSQIHVLMQKRFSEAPPVTAAGLREILSQIDSIMQPLALAQIKREDAVLIHDEFQHVADLLRHACYRLLMALGEQDQNKMALRVDIERLIEQQRKNWLARSRPGGLPDSLKRFDPLLNDYQT